MNKKSITLGIFLGAAIILCIASTQTSRFLGIQIYGTNTTTGMLELTNATGVTMNLETTSSGGSSTLKFKSDGTTMYSLEHDADGGSLSIFNTNSSAIITMLQDKSVEFGNNMQVDNDLNVNNNISFNYASGNRFIVSGDSLGASIGTQCSLNVDDGTRLALHYYGFIAGAGGNGTGQGDTGDQPQASFCVLMPDNHTNSNDAANPGSFIFKVANDNIPSNYREAGGLAFVRSDEGRYGTDTTDGTLVLFNNYEQLTTGHIRKIDFRISGGNPTNAATLYEGGHLMTRGNITNSGAFFSSNSVYAPSLQASNIVLATSSQSANYVTTTNDFFIAVDASGGARTITLTNTVLVGSSFVVKKIDASVNGVIVIVSGGSATIDGAGGKTNIVQNTAFKFVKMSATVWYIY